MGLYVRPAELAQEKGRKIELKPTFAETLRQLTADEEACALAQRGHGLVALVIRTENDHLSVQRSDQSRLEGVYAIPKSIVPKS